MKLTLSTFLKRLLYFSIGLSIGMVFLNFIVDKKTNGQGMEFCYLPNCRVLKELRNTPLRPIQDTAVIAPVLLNGKVLFSESDPRREPCKQYVVTYQGERYVFERCDTYLTYYQP